MRFDEFLCISILFLSYQCIWTTHIRDANWLVNFPYRFHDYHDVRQSMMEICCRIYGHLSTHVSISVFLPSLYNLHKICNIYFRQLYNDIHTSAYKLLSLHLVLYNLTVLESNNIQTHVRESSQSRKIRVFIKTSENKCRELYTSDHTYRNKYSGERKEKATREHERETIGNAEKEKKEFPAGSEKDKASSSEVSPLVSQVGRK